MIVGVKIEQTVTVDPRDYGNHWEVTSIRAVTELHSTKGWRKPQRSKRTQLVRPRPTIGEIRADTHVRFVPTDRVRRDKRPSGLSDAAMERAAARHIRNKAVTEPAG